MTDGMAMLQPVKTGGFCCNLHLGFLQKPFGFATRITNRVLFICHESYYNRPCRVWAPLRRRPTHG